MLNLELNKFYESNKSYTTMIQNDLQRLRWMILDEALRDPVMEYFMGERTKTNETGNTRS